MCRRFALSVLLTVIISSNAISDAAARWMPTPDLSTVNLLDRRATGDRHHESRARNHREDLRRCRPGTPDILGRKELWSYENTVATPWGVAIGGDHVFAGTAYEGPSAILFDLFGDGTPTWQRALAGVSCNVQASEDGNVLVMGWQDWNTGQSGLAKFHPGSSIPDWVYEFPSSYQWYCLAAVSRDGSRVAAVAANLLRMRIVLFDPSSSDPLWEYEELIGLPSPQVLRLSDGGDRLLVSDMGFCWVIDTTSCQKIWEGDATVSYGYSMSGNGDVLATSWEIDWQDRFTLWDFDGNTYQERWTYMIPGEWLYDTLELSADGSVLVAGATNWNDLNDNCLMVFDTAEPEPLWTLEYNGVGQIQDEISCGAVSDDGSRFVVGYWGDMDNTHQEFMAFDIDVPVPIFTIDTPGSVYGIDLTPDGRYAAVASKVCHANRPGFGGNVYAADLESNLAMEVSGHPLDPLSPGDDFSFTAEIMNEGDEVEYFNRVDLEVSGPTSLTRTLYSGGRVPLGSGQSVGDEVQLKVPGMAPAGTYRLDVAVYDRDLYMTRDGFDLVIE